MTSRIIKRTQYMTMNKRVTLAGRFVLEQLNKEQRDIRVNMLLVFSWFHAAAHRVVLKHKLKVKT